jgi:hypothetical protein
MNRSEQYALSGPESVSGWIFVSCGVRQLLPLCSIHFAASVTKNSGSKLPHSTTARAPKPDRTQLSARVPLRGRR